MMAATASAAAGGVVSAAVGRAGGERICLSLGDEAPDFSLPGSDGLTYRLSDFRGCQAVVIAWFPKSFTGG